MPKEVDRMATSHWHAARFNLVSLGVDPAERAVRQLHYIKSFRLTSSRIYLLEFSTVRSGCTIPNREKSRVASKFPSPGIAERHDATAEQSSTIKEFCLVKQKLVWTN
jgi:hypothetical protein